MKPVSYFLRALCLVSLTALIVPQTVKAADMIDGKPVIDRLEVDALEAGRVHKFWFPAAETSLGQRWYVPIMVMKGAEAGPKLLLNAALHGDELNGIAVIQRVFAEIDPTSLKGAVVAIPGANTPGVLLNSRFFHSTNDGGYTEDLNRLAPGDAESSSPGKKYVAALWEKVFKGNVDLAVDIHSQTRGTAYPLFIFADYRNPDIKRMAEALQPDIIAEDYGEEGTFETTFVSQGIPAVTLEIGSPKLYQWEYINHSVKGIRNVMIEFGLLEGQVMDLGRETFVGSDYSTLRAEVGGYVEVLVGLTEAVKKDQLVAIQRNAFGEEVADYKAPFDGLVLSIATDPLREPGSTVVRVIKR